MYSPVVVASDDCPISKGGSLESQFTTVCFHSHGRIGQCGIIDIDTSFGVARNCDARIYDGTFDELYKLPINLVKDSTILNTATDKNSRLTACRPYKFQSANERILTDSRIVQ